MSGTLEGRGAGARSARQHHARIGTSISPAPRNRSCRAAVRWPVRGSGSRRRRALILALPNDPGELTPISAIPRLTPDLAALYAGKTRKTLTRDVNCLQEAGLLAREGQAVRPPPGAD